MRYHLYIISLLIAFFSFPINLVSQGKTEKAVSNAIKGGNFSSKNVYKKTPFDSHKEFVYSVPKCEISESDFYSFFNSNPQYVIEGTPKKETKSHFGAVTTYITSFAFRNTSPEANTLEYGIQMANDNYKLKMPAFNDIHEANKFYLKHIKPYPDLEDRYLEEFAQKYTSYLKGNIDRVRKFCKESPYNEEIFDLPHPLYRNTERRIPVRSVLNSVLSNEDLVFYLKNGYGYIYNNKGRYLGDIVNGKANGQGEWVPTNDTKSTWAGEFKNGKMNGPITHTFTANSYKSISYKDGKDHFDIEEKGTCVDGSWDGAVEYKVRDGSFNPFISDFEIHHYNRGVLTNKEIKDHSLINGLNSSIAHRDNIEEDFRSGIIRIPRVRNWKYSRYDSNVIELEYTDGKRITIGKTDNGYTVYDNYSSYGYPESNFEKAQKYAYLLNKYDHPNMMQIINKYGLPSWE